MYVVYVIVSICFMMCLDDLMMDFFLFGGGSDGGNERLIRWRYE